MDLHSLVVGRDLMACRFEVVFNAGEVDDATEIAVDALDLVEHIEGRITVYRDTSELARLNAAAAAGWQPVSPDLFALLLHARGLAAATAGGFDCATGALTRAWGFLERRGRTPSATALAAARERSGLDLVEFDEAAGRVRFRRQGVELNLGAIGKGWAIDRAVAALRAAGVPSALVHGGQSSVRALGVQGPATPGRRGWKVGLRHPLRPAERLATITLADRALGTSGSGTQFFVDRGKKLGHILDPRTGRPADAGVISATVVAPEAADADALSTALSVLGEGALERLAPRGGAVGAVLVVPAAAPGAVRVVVANLDDDTCVVESPGAVEIERVA
ncbi:MAG: FAD:protein FMN transferase [Planctomycetia bacterium]|nr:FAD:protein FMN transferase [Planctomycetia bacterium]